MRREFSAKVKLAAWRRCKEHCENCGVWLGLYTGRFHYDHEIPDALGGEPTLENCKVLCANCHGAKTASTDIPTIAKSNRIRRKHLGIKKRSGWRR